MTTDDPTGQGERALPDDRPMTDRELLERAGEGVSRLVHAVPSDAWGRPTPCADWDVRALVNHLVSEHLWAPHLIRGETPDQVGDRYDGDVVGDDPAGAWDRAWAASRAAWAEVPDREEVELSSGATPAEVYRQQMLLDLVVHGWDLARGAGLDEQGDPSATARALEVAEREADAWSGSPMFGPRVETTSDEPLDRLVALLGRRP